MVSFDVDNLYGNIPRTDALLVLERKIRESKRFSKDEIGDIIKLTKIIISQSYFQYNNNTYDNQQGLPMGDVMSALLAELFMEDYEQKYIFSESNPFLNNIFFMADTWMIPLS